MDMVTPWSKHVIVTPDTKWTDSSDVPLPPLLLDAAFIPVSLNWLTAKEKRRLLLCKSDGETPFSSTWSAGQEVHPGDGLCPLERAESHETRWGKLQASLGCVRRLRGPLRTPFCLVLGKKEEQTRKLQGNKINTLFFLNQVQLSGSRQEVRNSLLLPSPLSALCPP